MLHYDPYCIEKIKQLNGSKYDVESKIWITDIDNKAELDILFSNTDFYEYVLSKS